AVKAVWEWLRSISILHPSPSPFRRNPQTHLEAPSRLPALAPGPVGRRVVGRCGGMDGVDFPGAGDIQFPPSRRCRRVGAGLPGLLSAHFSAPARGVVDASAGPGLAGAAG